MKNRTFWIALLVVALLQVPTVVGSAQSGGGQSGGSGDTGDGGGTYPGPFFIKQPLPWDGVCQPITPPEPGSAEWCDCTGAELDDRTAEFEECENMPLPLTAECQELLDLFAQWQDLC